MSNNQTELSFEGISNLSCTFTLLLLGFFGGSSRSFAAGTFWEDVATLLCAGVCIYHCWCVNVCYDGETDAV